MKAPLGTSKEFGGSGSVRALGHSIFTGGDPIDDLRCNIRDAVDRHFDETMQRRSVIRLHFVHDEILLA